jgi:hypothetical protein
LIGSISGSRGATPRNSADPNPDESQHEELDESQHEEPDESQHEEPDESQHEEPDENQHEEPDESRRGGPDGSRHEEPDESQREEPDESQHEEPDAERRLMCVNTGLIDPMVVYDAHRVADSSLIWIVGAFMRSSVQHRITKPLLSAMPFTNTSHLRTSLG